MNSKTQATKGFKTFLLTLVISLVVFSAIYFIINTEQEDESIDIETNSEQTLTAPYEKSDDIEAATLGESDTRAEDEVSVFGELASQKMEDTARRQVLAGEDVADTSDTTAMVATSGTEDTTPQSTVPDTGVSGPTMGVILTLIILGFAAYIMFIGPRNIALYNFEKDVVDDLD